MSLNINQALLIVKHWQDARKGREDNAVQERIDPQLDQGKTIPDVNAKRQAPEEAEKIIMNSYLRGATPERISKIGKIPLSTVMQVIAKGNV